MSPGESTTDLRIREEADALLEEGWALERSFQAARRMLDRKWEALRGRCPHPEEDYFSGKGYYDSFYVCKVCGRERFV
jgi:hypothetical protein